MFHGEIVDESVGKFRLYIPFGGNLDLLSKSVASVVERIRKYTKDPKPVVVINNTLVPLPSDFPNLDKIVEAIPPIELVHAQEFNWIIKMSKDAGEDFALTLHTDAQLRDGAVEDMFDTTNAIKGTKWAWTLAYGSGVFSALNWRFFEEEGINFDPFLFPFYYMDNHMYRIIESRGWKTLITKRAHENLVEHVSSYYLKEDPIFRRKNDLAFPLSGELYAKIWGGLPGKETNSDPTAAGTLRSKN